MPRQKFIFNSLGGTAILVLGLLMVQWAVAEVPAVVSHVQIEADQFELDGMKSRVIARGHVSVRQDNVYVTGDSGWYYKDDDRVEMNGNVRLVRGDVIITCNHVEVLGKQHQISASENVQFSYQDIEGTSERVSLDTQRQTLVLSGSPSAWRGEDMMVGSMITIQLDTKTIKATGRTRVVLSNETLQQKKIP